MSYRALCGFFFFSLIAASTTFAADYGIFKSEWNKIIVNKTMNVYGRDFSSAIKTTTDRSEPRSVLVRSISLKCINSELSSDWKEALRGLKTYHCAVRVDTDDSFISDQFCLIFTDANGLEVAPVEADTKFLFSRDDGSSKPITFAPSLSHGAPVSVDFYWVSPYDH